MQSAFLATQVCPYFSIQEPVQMFACILPGTQQMASSQARIALQCMCMTYLLTPCRHRQKALWAPCAAVLDMLFTG